MQDSVQIDGGMRDRRSIEGGIRDENILAGSRCRIVFKLMVGCGIGEVSRAGYGMKISWQDQDAG